MLHPHVGTRIKYASKMNKSSFRPYGVEMNGTFLVSKMFLTATAWSDLDLEETSVWDA
jgi:hypothetical protein